MTSTTETTDNSRRRGTRSRWAAIGAAVAVSLGAGGGFGFAQAVQTSGERSTFTPISPCRLTDTRASNQVGPRNQPVGAGETITIAARGDQGQCTAAVLPADASSIVLNVTALGATSQTFLTFWPDGTRPNAASLNPSVGAPPIPNAVTTKLASDGSFKLFNERGSVQVVIDVAGYYTDHNHDDRYYTRAEADTKFGGTGTAVVNAYTKQESDDRFASKTGTYTKTETEVRLTEELDNLLDVLIGSNGPIKINTREIQDLENHIENGRTVAINRHAFQPVNTFNNFRTIDQQLGVFVTDGASTTKLVAPVDLPHDAIVTGIRFRAQDQNDTTDLQVELFQVSPSGSREALGTATSSGQNNAVREFTGASSFQTTDDRVTYEIEVHSTIKDWGDVGNSLQLVGVFIDYKTVVAFDTP